MNIAMTAGRDPADLYVRGLPLPERLDHVIDRSGNEEEAKARLKRQPWPSRDEIELADHTATAIDAPAKGLGFAGFFTLWAIIAVLGTVVVILGASSIVSDQTRNAETILGSSYRTAGVAEVGR